jgi:hypothetical protein
MKAYKEWRADYAKYEDTKALIQATESSFKIIAAFSDAR